MHRFFPILLAVGVSACSWFGGGEPELSIEIIRVAAAAHDVRVVCVVDGDGDPVEFGGAAIDRLSDDFDILENQESIFEPADTFTVGLRVNERGEYQVQAFAVVDGFNVLSARTPVFVPGPPPESACTPPDGSLRVDDAICTDAQTGIEPATRTPNDYHTLTAECGSVSLRLLFPRKPTPQTYRLVDTNPLEGSSEKVVRIQGSVSGIAVDLPPGQSIDVSRRGQETVFTLCELDFFRDGVTGKLSGRLVYAD